MTQQYIPQIVFLEYMSRSGSTLLANRLDLYRDVFCTLEIDLPQYFYPLGGMANSPIPRFPLDTLGDHWDHIWSDKKLQAWDLPKNRMREIISSSGDHKFGIQEIIESIARCIAEREGVHTVIFKGILKNPQHHLAIRDFLPHCKLLGIIRDPRATFSSQLNSQRAHSRFPIGYSRKTFINHWKRYVEYFQDNAGNAEVFFCRYEELVTNESAVLDSITGWLELPDTSILKESDYGQRIPEAQIHLHENISREKHLAPLNAWKKILPGPAWRKIESDLGDIIKTMGYERGQVPPCSISDRILYEIRESWTSGMFQLHRGGLYLTAKPKVAAIQVMNKMKRSR